jgi:flagellar motor component MotA
MIEWIKQIFGFKSETEKKRDQIKRLHEKAFQAQRNGDLSLAGKYQKQADEIADSILNSKLV